MTIPNIPDMPDVIETEHPGEVFTEVKVYVRELTFARLQEEHKDWVYKNFPSHSSDEAFLGIVEELGELSHAILKSRQGIRGNPEDLELKAMDAIGDLVIFITSYCNARGWNLQDIVESTWEQVSQRDWQQDKLNGVTG